MRYILSILVITFILSAVAFSQGTFGKEGVIEFGGTVGFMSSTPVANGETGDATSTFTVVPSVGYFFMDGLEVGLNPLSFVSTKPPVGDSYSNIGIWAFGAYHLMTMGTTYPYIEGLIGYTSESNGETLSGLSYGLGIGAKFEITGGLLLNAAAEYRFYTYNPSGADKRFGMNVLSIGVGLSGFLTK
jgi:hypothetical protein